MIFKGVIDLQQPAGDLVSLTEVRVQLQNEFGFSIPLRPIVVPVVIRVIVKIQAASDRAATRVSVRIFVCIYLYFVFIQLAKTLKFVKDWIEKT